MQEQQERTGEDQERGSGLAQAIVLYTLARLGLLAVAIVVLALFNVPLLVAAVVSVVLVMPLSMLVFASLRRRVAGGIAQRTAQRREQRAKLRAQLRGEDAGSASE